VTISATYNGSTACATLGVIPAGLQLTTAGAAEGFGLSTFAYGFVPNSYGFSALGVLVYGKQVFVADSNLDLLRLFPTDTDWQNAAATPFASWNHGVSGLALLDDTLYAAGNNQVTPFSGSGAPGTAIVTSPTTAIGLCADPIHNCLYLSDGGVYSTIYKIDPVGKTIASLVTGLGGPDGMVLSTDGSTLYAAIDAGDDVVGIDTGSGAIVWDFNQLGSGVSLSGPDGIALGMGTLAGKLYVNCNGGQVYEITLATGAATLIATNGTRGDFAPADPNGTLLLTQSDRVMRLIPPAGGSFRDLTSSVIATRDDLTNPNTTPYSAFSLTAPALTANAAQNGVFDFTGFSGGVVAGNMQRGGQLGWNSGVNFDLALGLTSTTNSLFTSFGSSFAGYQNNTPNPGPYTYAWDLPAPYPPGGAFPMDIQNNLGGVYGVHLTDQLANTSGSYTITDTPEQGWPTLGARNILTGVIYPYGNPAIAQGRALDITLPWTAAPANGTWEIRASGTVIASSVAPNGWDVGVDFTEYNGAWVTVPSSASAGVGYEVRLARVGSGFFDVVASSTTAPVLLPLTAQNTAIVGGNSTTATVTLDAPAPTGGATVSLQSLNAVVSVPTSVTIPGGQTSATFTISTQTVTAPIGALVLASFNGKRALEVIVAPTGIGTPGAPQNLMATGMPGAVQLTWTAPSGGPYTYNVKRATISGGPYTVIARNVGTTSYLDTAVANNTTYYYVVSAVNILGVEGPNSTEASAKPTASTPLAGLVLHPATVVGTQYSIGTVTLQSAAPQNGQPVTLSSSSPSAASVPSSVTVPAGYLSADFAITTSPVNSDTAVTIQATAGNVTDTATLTVQAPSVKSVTFAPNPVTGGSSATGTVTMNAPVSTSGATVTLSASPGGLVSFSPTTVTIPGGGKEGGYGATSATFSVSTSSVSSSTKVSVTASHTTNSDGAATGTLTVNPTNMACYISNLTVSPTGIVGSGTVTGTVTLSAAAPSGGATVLLASSDPSVTVPPSVTVSAGSQTATFTATANYSGSSVNYVTLSGSYNTWTQAATLTVLPAGYNLTVQSLTATGGNGCILLHWLDLPFGSVQGYNVYRIINGTRFPLNSSPLPNSIYADCGLSNGMTYQYQVAVVDLQGHESSVSVSATTSATAPTIAWNTPITTVTNDAILFTSQPSVSVPYSSTILVDGKIVGSGTTPSPGSSSPSSVLVRFSSQGFSNGSHVVQLVGTVGATAFATPPLTLQMQNNFSNLSVNGILQSNSGDASMISMTMPSGTTSWTAQILDQHNNVLRSWQGLSATAQLAWDGNDGTGNTAPNGCYSLSVSAAGTSGSISGIWPISTVGSSPQALALLDYADLDVAGNDTPATRGPTQAVGAYIQKVFATSPWLFPNNGLVLFPDTLYNGAPLTAVKIQKWLATSVADFYLYAHGTYYYNGGVMESAKWGDITFYPNIKYLPLPQQSNDIQVDLATLNRPFNFVWLDCCHSAGGAAKPNDANPATPDDTWAEAFNVYGTGEPIDAFLSYGAFWGWDGTAGTNASTLGGTSNWYTWRMDFWYALANEYNLIDAGVYATLHTPGTASMNPWDQIGGIYRAQIFGDPLHTLP
jgi:hypothetical protein